VVSGGMRDARQPVLGSATLGWRAAGGKANPTHRQSRGDRNQMRLFERRKAVSAMGVVPIRTSQ
jgi:hypothetical protein